MGYPTAKPVDNWEELPPDQTVLVIQKDNYADEFDFEGWELWKVGEFWQYVRDVRRLDYPLESYFGTNEFVMFEDADEYLSGIKVYLITDEERATLEKFFGRDFGMFHNLDVHFDFDDEDE